MYSSSTYFLITQDSTWYLTVSLNTTITDSHNNTSHIQNTYIQNILIYHITDIFQQPQHILLNHTIKLNYNQLRWPHLLYIDNILTTNSFMGPEYLHFII